MIFYFDDLYQALARDFDKIGQSSYKLQLLAQNFCRIEMFDFLKDREEYLRCLAEDIKDLRKDLGVEIIDQRAA